MRCLWLVAVACWCGFAQAPPAEAPPPTALENTGKPMRLPFQCTEEDLRSFGLTCPPQHPCPVYLELSGLEPVGNKIFVSGNIHTEAATLASALLVGSDSGKTWAEPHERIRAAGLDQIQFLDFEAGWVAGLFLYAVPRDPFLLLTTDGGKSWRLRPVTAEGRVGTIEAFWFDSRSRGTVLMDRTQAGETSSRYEMYETETGGESWMIREVSDRPIRSAQKRIRPPNPDWRLHADRATQSYRIEKRLGERWQPVAAFLIQIGECRAPEIAVPPAPVEPQVPTPAPVAPAPKAPRQPPSLKKPAAS